MRAAQRRAQKCGLTPHSSRAPTAVHLAVAAVQCIIGRAGQAPVCRARLSSNVRPRRRLARAVLALPLGYPQRQISTNPEFHMHPNRSNLPTSARRLATCMAVAISASVAYAQESLKTVTCSGPGIQKQAGAEHPRRAREVSILVEWNDSTRDYVSLDGVRHLKSATGPHETKIEVTTSHVWMFSKKLSQDRNRIEETQVKVDRVSGTGWYNWTSTCSNKNDCSVWYYEVDSNSLTCTPGKATKF